MSEFNYVGDASEPRPINEINMDDFRDPDFYKDYGNTVCESHEDFTNRMAHLFGKNWRDKFKAHKDKYGHA